MDEHGRSAERPTEIPRRGWWDVLVRTKAEVKADRVTMLSAAVAFYALFALVPALVAMISVYGLFADPSAVESQVRSWLGAAPSDVRDLVVSQLTSITQRRASAIGLGAVFGILVALWSAAGGVGHLVDAVNIAYDETDRRGWFRRKALALLLTVGAVVFVVFAVTAIAVLPAWLADTGLGPAGRIAAGVLRWVVLLFGMLVALAVLYRWAPDRDEPRWRWTSVGAVVATVLWLVVSIGFSVYTANFGSYDTTYGSLGAVVVLMFWLFLTAFCVILGAELNAELERQTAKDTTDGPERPMGARDATVADTVGATADEVRAGHVTDEPADAPEARERRARLGR